MYVQPENYGVEMCIRQEHIIYALKRVLLPPFIMCKELFSRLTFSLGHLLRGIFRQTAGIRRKILEIPLFDSDRRKIKILTSCSENSNVVLFPQIPKE